MKKLSLKWLVPLVLFSLLMAYAVVDNVISLSQYYKDYLEKKHAYIYNLAKMASKSSQSPEEIQEILKIATQAHLIDFFVIRKNHKAIFVYPPDSQDKGLVHLKGEPNTQVLVDKRFFIQVPFQGQQLLVGGYMSLETFLIQGLSQFWKEMLLSLFFILLIALGVFFYFLKDFLSTLKKLQSTSHAHSLNLPAHSKEADLLLKGLAGLEEKEEHLKQANQLMSSQILPALRSELFSGRTPPYIFSCTLVRTDINHFTEILSAHPMEEFMQVVNGFFVQVSEIVSVYQGYVYEFIGDEVIFYFKDEEHPNSAAIALSALRDIQKAAQDIQRKAPYPFTIKSAVAKGPLRFGTQVHNYTLSGGVLIETVRLLSLVSEKKKHFIAYDKNIAQATDFLCKSQFWQKTTLKGLPGEYELFYCQHYQCPSDLSPTRLIYHRSPQDLTHFFEKALFQHKDKEWFLNLASSLKNIQLLKSHPELTHQWLCFLKEVKKTAPDFFSQCISFCKNLVPQSPSKELTDFLYETLQSSDPRQVANTLEALSHYKLPLPQDFLKATHNRILANAIIKAGQEELHPKTIKALKKLLNHSQDLYKASGLYALRSLCLHWMPRDMVIYKTTLLPLLEDLQALCFNPSPYVLTQLLQMVEKIPDFKNILQKWAHRHPQKVPEPLRQKVAA